LETSVVRVIVVDDYAPWCRFICSTFQRQPQLRIVAEIADGLKAVQKAKELEPDLILMDIGIPTLNGIEAARRILELLPETKILFLTENRSIEIAKQTLRIGARGYVVKSDAAGELFTCYRSDSSG